MKQKHYPHKPLIEDKLEKLPAPATDELWSNMQERLEAHMPDRKKRPIVLAWQRTNRAMSLLLILLMAGGSAIYMLVKYTGKPIVATTAPVDASQANKKLTENVEQSGGRHGTNTLQQSNDRLTTNTIEQSNHRPATNMISGRHGQLPPAQTITTSLLAKENQRNKKGTIKDKASPAINPAIHPLATAPTQEKLNTVSALTPQDLASGKTETNTPPTKSDNEIKEIIPETPMDTNEATEQTTKKAFNKKETGLYAGVVLGADLSSVKFNKGHAGHSKGFILGYAFNRKWSVESGIFFSEKKYVSPGKYFNPTHSPMPAGVNMLSVCGENYLYEIPLQIRHTVITGRHNLFVTAGLSSYLMREENYTYDYEYNGQQGRNYASYKNAGDNVFSVASASIGYSYQLGRLGRIRVEPYLKLPVNELGINRIPITSTGLQVGITRFLSR